MKILVIRHGEPDYSKDCLTQNGTLQAKMLAKRLESEDIAAAYTSTMGRARQTAHIALTGRNIPLTEFDWLREFDVRVKDKDISEPVPVWDLYPKNWTGIAEYYDKELFYTAADAMQSDIHKRYLSVCKGLDELLALHGLERRGQIYHAVSGHDKTIALFCHFGATCVITAHLLGISPIVTLQGFSAEPTAIATLCTDDRFGNDVNFRLHGFGDINHLGTAGNGQINYK